ncbi:MAG: hypothetical protein QOJ69_2262, partial [Actinomycetota bacterium]|nr:hypothetical protein [Actinomycetota bacterium]
MDGNGRVGGGGDPRTSVRGDCRTEEPRAQNQWAAGVEPGRGRWPGVTTTRRSSWGTRPSSGLPEGDRAGRGAPAGPRSRSDDSGRTRAASVLERAVSRRAIHPATTRDALQRPQVDRSAVRRFRQPGPPRRAVAGVALSLLLGACSGSNGSAAPSLTTGAPASSAPTTGAPPTSTSGLSSLPSGCPAGRVAPPSAVVAFVSAGRAWATAPDDLSTLTCLFSSPDPGACSWGPRGDRVLLSGLEVRGVGSSVSRPPIATSPAYFSWSRPTGTTVIFTDSTMRTIQRADMGTAQLDAITPLPDVTYGDLAYHPSGLAIGFVANRPTGSELWMSTNQGKDPVLLVRGDSGARFG